MQKVIRRRQPGQQSIAASDTLHPRLARIYSARGALTPDELDLSLPRLLPPARLLNADSAALLLADAIAAGRKLLVIGL
jgi:single-stranded-DNA-specific exonuclease